MGNILQDSSKYVLRSGESQDNGKIHFVFFKDNSEESEKAYSKILPKCHHGTIAVIQKTVFSTFLNYFSPILKKYPTGKTSRNRKAHFLFLRQT